MGTLNTWLAHWEPLWLFVVLAVEMLAGIYTALMVKKEFDYDKDKDDQKRQRKTRTSKKTTTNPGGISVVEELTETTEPVNEAPK